MFVGLINRIGCHAKWAISVLAFADTPEFCQDRQEVACQTPKCQTLFLHFKGLSLSLSFSFLSPFWNCSKPTQSCFFKWLICWHTGHKEVNQTSCVCMALSELIFHANSLFRKENLKQKKKEEKISCSQLLGSGGLRVNVYIYKYLIYSDGSKFIYFSDRLSLQGEWCSHCGRRCLQFGISVASISTTFLSM